MHLPSHIQSGEKVVLCDGVCKLCNGWSQFLIRYDTAAVFKRCSVQSPEGQAILAWFGLPIDRFDTMLYVEGNRAYQQSEAFLQIVRQLPAPRRYMGWFRVLPEGLRKGSTTVSALRPYRTEPLHAVLPRRPLPATSTSA